MKYKIIVDKQSRLKPSSEKREYEIDIEELRYKGDIHDSLIITRDEDYVIRRLSLSPYHVLKILEKPVKEELKGINIQLFEGDNYIYLVDMTGNKFFAEYILKNDFTDTYCTKVEMYSQINQTVEEIDLSVNKKLDNYSTTVQMNSAINLKVDSIKTEVSGIYETKTDANNTKKKLQASLELKLDTKKLISEINASADIIYFKSNRLIIESTNCKLTKEGNMTLSNANIEGNIKATTGKIGQFEIVDGNLRVEKRRHRNRNI